MGGDEEDQAGDELRVCGGKAHGDEAAEGDAENDVRRSGDCRGGVADDFVEGRGGVAKDGDAVAGEESRDLMGVA